MKTNRSRREFLADVGQGMLVASVGLGTAVDMGLSPARAGEGAEPLTFGAMEPLVALMQETPAAKLMPILVERLRAGAELRELVAAAALANARTFGGEDYVGYHTMMALSPAFRMSRELPEARRPLPVLKVLFRNSAHIQEQGGRKNEVLHPVAPARLPDGRVDGEVLREAVRSKNVAGAEETFAAIVKKGSADDAFNALLYAVHDNTDVHRVVLPYRAWDLLGLIGQEQAHTLLRQSVRFCVASERADNHSAANDKPRTLLPRLFDQYRLIGRSRGGRAAEDGWIDRMSRTIFESDAETAADAAAAALAEGIDPEAIGEAIALAANQLVLRDRGRTSAQASADKPAGSVHGASTGVHACDSANAWRNMSRVSNDRNMAASLILGAYQVARDRAVSGGDFLGWQSWPVAESREKVKEVAPDALLGEVESAIRGNDQARATALVARIGDLGQPSRPVFDLLLRFAISEDGALHAEKYYRTVTEEFAATRPAFRWRQLIALARVTASEFGRPAPGYAESCELLKV